MILKFSLSFFLSILKNNFIQQVMESAYVPGTNKEQAEIEKPAIDLYELTKKIQYPTIRNEFHLAEELLHHLPEESSTGSPAYV